MLHDSFSLTSASKFVSSRPHFSEGALAAAGLVASAMAALDDDPRAVRSYLGQLEGLLADFVGGADVANDVEPEDEVRSPSRGGLAAWQIKRVERHIAENLASTITLEDLADLTRLSHGHLCRSFKVSLGDSPHRYIMRKRVEKARSLMLTTADTLSHIAFECGLADQAHLTRLFRKFVGETPMAWRRNWQREAA